LLQASTGTADELQIGQQQIDAHRDPDLGHYSVLRRTQKGLDLEVLLDPLEEQFDLPARLVDRRDGGGGQLEIVRQENVFLAGFGIAISHASQRNRAGPALGAGQLDGLVTGQVLSSLDSPALKHAVPGIALLSGDEENSAIIQLVIPSVVGVATIKGNDRSGRQRQCATRRDIVGLAVGDRDKGRQHTRVVQSDMQFDRALGLAEPGPGKHRKAHINGRGVERKKLVLEPETMTRGLMLTATQELEEQRFVQGPGLLFVGPRQTGAADQAHAEMIKLAGLSCEIAEQITQARAAGQLGAGHRHELRPTADFAQFPALMVLPGERFEFMSRQQFEHLGEHGARMGHGLVSPFGSVC